LLGDEAAANEATTPAPNHRSQTARRKCHLTATQSSAIVPIGKVITNRYNHLN
jgi:hypothetical protein